MRWLALRLGVLFLSSRRAAGLSSLRDSDLKELQQHHGVGAAPPSCATEPCGEPLFLSPLIARDPKAARVASQIKGLEHFDGSFSGLITVDEASKNALFFWYMPAIHPPVDGSTPPCIMWLQGGPGAPSTYGMFTEIGPVIVGTGGILTPRNHTWNAKYGLLIVDNPAGVGFSFLGDVAKPVDTEMQVGREMVSFLVQFCKVFPELYSESAGLFIAGESYGGKYAPASAWSVLQYNKGRAAASGIPLRGLVIGDGWSDPAIHVQNYGSMLRGMGLLGTAEYEVVQAALLRSTQRLAAGDFVGAFDGWCARLSLPCVSRRSHAYGLLQEHRMGRLRRKLPWEKLQRGHAFRQLYRCASVNSVASGNGLPEPLTVTGWPWQAVQIPRTCGHQARTAIFHHMASQSTTSVSRPSAGRFILAISVSARLALISKYY